MYYLVQKLEKYCIKIPKLAFYSGGYTQSVTLGKKESTIISSCKSNANSPRYHFLNCRNKSSQNI